MWDLAIPICPLLGSYTILEILQNIDLPPRWWKLGYPEIIYALMNVGPTR